MSSSRQPTSVARLRKELERLSADLSPNRQDPTSEIAGGLEWALNGGQGSS